MLVNTPHPVLVCAAAIDAALQELAGVEPAFMRTSEKAEAMVEFARLGTQLAAWQMRIMATADDVAEETGARDVAAWLAHQTHDSPKACRAELHLAAGLDGRWMRLGEAVATGAVNLAQAKVIARALEELPDDLDPDLLIQAEEHLIEAAAHHSPDQLRVLGRKILDVIAPDVGEAEEAKQLAREEERAWETTSLTLTRRGDGTTRLSGALPDATAARLVTYLDAFTSPRQARVVEQRGTTAASRPRSRGRDAGAVVETTTVPQHRARGQAFTALLEHLDPAKLPDHGGAATTVIVTINSDSLTRDLASAGLLGTDDKITASEARRLACNAQILPAVLGGKSEILDFGRSRRLFSPAQHKAMRLRDQRCRGEGCSIPATWCEAHHWKPWSIGGKTDLADGVLLCSHHHHRAHDNRYSTARMPNGDIRFHAEHKPRPTKSDAPPAGCHVHFCHDHRRQTAADGVPVRPQAQRPSDLPPGGGHPDHAGPHDRVEDLLDSVGMGAPASPELGGRPGAGHLHRPDDRRSASRGRDVLARPRQGHDHVGQGEEDPALVGEVSTGRRDRQPALLRRQ